MGGREGCGSREEGNVNSGGENVKCMEARVMRKG